MKLAIVGITGMVGKEVIAVLEEMNFKIDELIAVASKKSIGKTIHYNNDSYSVLVLKMLLIKIQMLQFFVPAEILLLNGGQNLLRLVQLL